MTPKIICECDLTQIRKLKIFHVQKQYSNLSYTHSSVSGLLAFKHILDCYLKELFSTQVGVFGLSSIALRHFFSAVTVVNRVKIINYLVNIIVIIILSGKYS